MASFGGNMLRIGAYIDDQVSKKLTGIRAGFDGLAKSKGVGLLAQGFGMGAGIGVWNLASQAIGRATDFIKGSIDAASNLNETITKSQQIFGPAFDDIERWAEGAADAFGQSERQALDTASTFAGLFQTVGVAADESAASAQRLTELGSDLASFFNTDVQTAIGAIRSGLAGESEPLRRFNVFLSETAVAAKAAELGMTKVGGKLTEQQKILARQAIIFEQTTAAQGDFARTSDQLANSQRSLTAQMENAQAKLGEGLLPAVLAVTKAFSDLLTVVGDVNDAFAETSEVLEKTKAPGADLLSTLLNLVPGGKLAFAASVEVSGGMDKLGESLDKANQKLTDTTPFNTAAQRMSRFGEVVEGVGEQTKEGLGEAGDALETGKRNILSSARDLVSKLKSTFTMRSDWDTLVGDLGDFLERFSATIYGDDQEAAQEWADRLTATLEGPMTGEERAARLREALNLTGDIGSQLKAGLESSDPLIREAAKNALASIPELLKALEREAKGYGENTGKAFADGLRASGAQIEAAAKGAVVKARNVFLATSPPGPDSPLHEIDRWGEATGEAWAEGLGAGVSDTSAVLDALAQYGEIFADARPEFEALGADLGTATVEGLRAALEASGFSAAKAAELASGGLDEVMIQTRDVLAELVSEYQVAGKSYAEAAQAAMNDPRYLSAQTALFEQAGYMPVGPGTYLPATPGYVPSTEVTLAADATRSLTDSLRSALTGLLGAPEIFLDRASGVVQTVTGGGDALRPVVIQLTVDGRVLSETVDRNLFYKYRLAAS